jgi:hypothetical protein
VERAPQEPLQVSLEVSGGDTSQKMTAVSRSEENLMLALENSRCVTVNMSVPGSRLVRFSHSARRESSDFEIYRNKGVNSSSSSLSCEPDNNSSVTSLCARGHLDNITPSEN